MSDAKPTAKSEAEQIGVMKQRYARALRLTAPKIATRTAGLAVEGYWLDKDRFFFLAERFEPSVGRVVSTPSIARCKTQEVEELISLDALLGLLREHGPESLNLEALSRAEFDMLGGDSLGVSIGGRDYVVDSRRRQVVRSRTSLEVPALYSSDGRWATFLRGEDLWLRELAAATEKPLTTDGAPHYAYGRQPETCTSAVTYRKRPVPMGLWSPDSQWFLTHRIDERSLPDLDLIQHAPAGGGRPILHSYKYAMPGDPVPVATYTAFHVASGRTVTLAEFELPVLGYSPFYWRMAWFETASAFWFIRLDRYFKTAELIHVDLLTGKGRIVLRDVTASGYIDLNPMYILTPNVRTLPDSNEIIWFSERDGWGHLYLHDAATGELKNRITCGEWLVRDIIHVDEAERRVVFTACGVDPQVDPARRSLCTVGLDGRGFKVLIAHGGDVIVPRTEPGGLAQDRPFRPSYAQPGVSPDSRFSLVRFASIERGNRTEIVDLREKHSFVVAAAAPAQGEVLPRVFNALAADGVTRVHGVLFLPSDFDENRRYPLIDYIYPGPQGTQQPQSFGPGGSFARALAELGFITLMLDTRGVPFRSRAIHQSGYGELLEPQLADHVAVVHQLCGRHPFIDSDRVGMIGLSGGGSATARALFDYGDLFKVGVSACGNHDSTFYTALWSDKYRGSGNRARWATQANSVAAHKLKGKLLLISGDMDENVHLSHTLCLADALIRANRDFDLLIVPNAGHVVLLTCGYAQRRAWDYFVRHLLGQTPPPAFEIEFEPHEVTRLEKCIIREFRS